MDQIDINCDLGEGQANDSHLLDFISSCNISCGFHAGDPTIIRRTIENAISKGVKVGAHPSYDDKENFGRKSLQVTGQELHDQVMYQVSALYSMTMALGDMLHHVKLHGALYNDTALNSELAEWCFRAIKDVDAELPIYGLPGTKHELVAKKLGIKFIAEAFGDRRYTKDGQLAERSINGAIITDPKEAGKQVMWIVKKKQLETISGDKIPMKAQTVCFHGDHSGALKNLQTTRALLKKYDIELGFEDEY